VPALLVALGGIGSSLAQTSTSQPSSRTHPAAHALTTDDQRRFAELLALIEGQNPPAARRTGARELLRQGWPETTDRLGAILRGSNAAAKTAVALALADLPERFDPAYLDPLLAMLADEDAEVRGAAARALATRRSKETIERLRGLVLDAEVTLHARLAAIDVLASMTQREAIGVLVEALADPHGPVAETALHALESATAMDFHGDIAAARTWWQSTRDMPLEQWQQMQIDRLVRLSRADREQIRTLENRLALALRTGYFRLPESERPDLLASYLSDPTAVVRVLGLEIVQSLLAEGRPLAPQVAESARALLAAPEPKVRAAAARAVAAMRDAQDAPRFLERLQAERNPEVRRALINALGYVGDAGALESLLALLDDPDAATGAEAVTALGRLAERGVVDGERRTRLARILVERFEQCDRSREALRERLLWAVGRTGEALAAPVYIRVLKATEPPPVKLAAVSGIAGVVKRSIALAASDSAQPLDRGLLADALVPLVADNDVAVRRLAIETLAQVGFSDAHLQALWGRLTPQQEQDEVARAAAWRGVVRLLENSPVEQITAWIERLPPNGSTRTAREIELLQLAERKLARASQRRADLGHVRARLAAARVTAGLLDDALRTYLEALDDLRAAGSPDATQAALDLLRLALRSGRYGPEVVAALGDDPEPVDPQWLWQQIRDDIKSRLRGETLTQAMDMLRALRAHPPAWLPTDARNELDGLLRRALQLEQEALRTRIDAALARLRDNPQDSVARQQIIALGPRAVPILRGRLLEVLSADPPDPQAERRLHDLLKAVVPGWPGFAPDAPLEQKRRALEPLATAPASLQPLAARPDGG